MADQYHVEDALLALVTDILYPDGAAAPSVSLMPYRIHRGWPLPAALEHDLARGITTISISPVDGSQKITTRYPDEWTVTAAIAPTLVADIVSDQVRLSGVAAPRQLIGVLADSRTAVHRLQAEDTIEVVAAQLAHQLRAHRIVHYAGTALIIPGVHDLRARVVADQPARRELRRQSQIFRISCFCPGPRGRDETSDLIDMALARMRFFTLADGSTAHLAHENSVTLDTAEIALLYRRDLLVRVEYATTDTALLPALLFGAGSVNSAPFIG